MELMHPRILQIGIPIIVFAAAALHISVSRGLSAVFHHPTGTRRERSDARNSADGKAERKRRERTEGHGQRNRYRGGTRTAAADFVQTLPEYRRRRVQYGILMGILEGGLLLGLVSLLVLMARPYRTETVTSGVKKRDIYLCLDVSYSIYQLNYDIVDSLEQVVGGMQGDRFGISIYNTSTVTYVPMTDDYDFVISRLETLKQYFQMQKQYMTLLGGRNDWTELSADEQETLIDLSNRMETVEAGTVTNNAAKGSSLVGEGLATCLYSFPGIRTDERTRIILMATDNMEEAVRKPLVELPEAADLCRQNGTVVFGIYPQPEEVDGLTSEEDYQDNRTEYEEAVESTGGCFYVESKTYSVDQILADMQKQEAMAVKSVSVTRQVDEPQKPGFMLAAGLTAAALAGIVLRKV